MKKNQRSFRQSLRNDFRSLFITGLLVIIPVWVTYLTIRFLLGLMDKALFILPERYQPENLLGFHLPGLGIIVAVFAVLVVGFVTRNFIGRRLVKWGEKLIENIPLVRVVYSSIKKFTYMVLGGQRDFQRAIVFEYPRRGIWSIGFVTNRISPATMPPQIPPTTLSVFVPTTPNPTSGWIALVPEEECYPLDMPIDEAFKIVISGGVVMPEKSEITKQLAAPAAAS